MRLRAPAVMLSVSSSFMLLLSASRSPVSAQRPAAPSARQLLEAEHARATDVSVLMAGTRSSNPLLQRQAVRALGRFERASLRDSVAPLLRATNADVRREAANALGQINAPFDFAPTLANERSAVVRAAIYETMGRMTPGAAGVEGMLRRGLAERDTVVRTGAARGVEAFLRKQGRAPKATRETVASLRIAMRDNRGEEIRQLLLLALTAVGDRDSTTMSLALRDPSAQVRRLAVAASRQWLDDPSPMVRYQALHVAGTCERYVAALRDRSEHVALTAIDLIGERACEAALHAPLLQMVIADGTTWRMRAHALVALARIAPDSARSALSVSANSRTWQERSYAATTAKLLSDSATLARLARDTAPNVAIAAMTTPDDAMRALTRNHAGLLLAAAAQLKGSAQLSAAAPALRAALQRLSAQHRSTLRDPIVAITERLRELGDPATVPAVGEFPLEPLPSDSALRSLRGATVNIRLRGLGTMTLELLPDEAPLAVATFVQLAETGKFNGLTFHRIVSNFVIQGGSPGADEYDGISAGFMRDEVGFARNARGSLGISTRGRDTGDGQLYINLVDNFRLDHDYTVFARVTAGMDVVDRVQEGDVMQSLQVVRRPTTRR